MAGGRFDVDSAAFGEHFGPGYRPSLRGDDRDVGGTRGSQALKAIRQPMRFIAYLSG